MQDHHEENRRLLAELEASRKTILRLQQALHQTDGERHTAHRLPPDPTGGGATHRPTAMADTGISSWSWRVSSGEVVLDERWAEILGYSLTELEPVTMQGWIDRCHPDDRSARQEALARHLEGSTELFECEYRMQHRDGHWVWILDRGKVVDADRSGHSLLVSGVHCDITRRKKAESILQEDRENFRAFFESIRDMVVVATPEGQILHANSALYRKLGYTAQDLPTLTVLGLHPPELRAEAEAIMQAIVNGEALSCPLPLYTKAGRTIPVETHAWQGRWNGKECIFGISEDLSLIAEANQRFERLFRHNPALMAVSSVHRKFVDANETFYTALGFTREEVVGKSAEELNLFVDTDRQQGIAEELFAKGRVADIELQVRCKDGTLRDGLFFGELITSQGKTYLLTVMVDITEIRKTQVLLKEQTERYRGIFDESIAAIYIFDAQKRFIDSNQAGLDLLGYSRDELLKMSIPDVDADPQVVLPAHRQLLSGSRIINYEHRLIRKDGTVISVLNNSRPLVDSNGQVTGMQSTLVDITDRHRAEEALRQSEERYDRLFNSVMEGLVIIDGEEYIRYCNPAIADIFGAKTAQELVGRCLLEFVSDSECKRLLRRSELRRKGVSDQYRLDIVNLAGTRKTLLISASPWIGDDGRFNGTFGAVMDITEMLRLQEAESRTERLEAAALVAGQVAHDFNNLLAPLIAYPEFIKDALPPDDEAREYVDAIKYAAEQIATLNQDLLTLGRRGHYTQEVLNLNHVVRRAVDEMKVRADAMAYNLRLGDDLMNVRGGVAQIHRVLSNLIANAQDAMNGAGEIAIETQNCYVDSTTVQYSHIPVGEYVKLSITDHGCGIPEAIAKRVFDPFFSTKRSSTRRGSGLGLSVVDAVIRDHRGFIDLHTKVGQGTCVDVYLPICREEPEVAASEAVVGGREQILVVDDDQVQREVTCRLLQRLGYRATAAVSGEQALDLIGCAQYDLVILDMVMPGGIDGAETLRRALLINPRQKAIIQSGYSNIDRADIALQLGATAFLHKPVTFGRLAATVRQALDVDAPGRH